MLSSIFTNNIIKDRRTFTKEKVHSYNEQEQIDKKQILHGGLTEKNRRESMDERSIQWTNNLQERGHYLSLPQQKFRKLKL